ncbi:MAG: hypothetical protein ACMUJM_17610 [bacterium]
MGLEITSSKLRFKRGAGPSGILAIFMGIIVVVHGILAIFVFKWLWLQLVGGVAFITALILLYWMIKRVSNWPKHFLEISPSEKKVIIGQVKNGADIKEIELDINKAQYFLCKSRYNGAGADFSLYAKIGDSQGIPAKLRERLSNTGEVDLMPWTQEFRGTIQKMLKFLREHNVRIR